MALLLNEGRTFTTAKFAKLEIGFATGGLMGLKFINGTISGPELEIPIHGCQFLYRARDSTGATGATTYNLKISRVPGTRGTRAISGPVTYVFFF